MGYFDDLAQRATQSAPLPRPAGRTASPLTELDQRLHTADHALLLEAPLEHSALELDASTPLPASQAAALRVDTPQASATAHTAPAPAPETRAPASAQAEAAPSAGPIFPPSVLPRAAQHAVRAESPASSQPVHSPGHEMPRTSATVATTVVRERITEVPAAAPSDRLNAALARLDRWMEAPPEPARTTDALTPTPRGEPARRVAATPVLPSERALPPVRTAEPVLPSAPVQNPVSAARPEVTLRIGRIVVEVVTPTPAKPKLATTPARTAPPAPSVPTSAPSAPALPFGWRQR